MRSLARQLRRFTFITCAVTLIALSLAVSHAQPQGPKDQEPEKGLRMRLSDARPTVTPITKPKSADEAAKALNAAELQRILNRLRPPAKQPGDQMSLALRPNTMPPPKTGKVVTAAFPPRSSNEPVPPFIKPNEALEVARFAPAGEIMQAPNVTITFSQPMVPLTSQEQAAQIVPATLTPQPKGQWRWLGTRTLIFEPTGEPGARFPLGTEYTVTVPAGTRSALGNALGTEERWTFGTPALEVVNFLPQLEGEHNRRPLLFFEFNQRIATERIVTAFALQTADGKRWPLVQATAQEIARDWKIEYFAQNAQAECWLVLRLAEDAVLPPATNYALTLKAGTYSLEGPRPMDSDWTSASLSTYQHFKLLKHDCSGRVSQACVPMNSSLRIEFNNALASTSFSAKHIHIEPPVADLKINGYGASLMLNGTYLPRTVYRVTLKASLADQYNQTLGTDQTVEFTFGDAEMSLQVPGWPMVTLDPAGPRSYPIYSLNHESIAVRLYAVTPEDYGSFAAAMRARMTYDRNKKDEPFPEIGRRLRAETVMLNAKPNEAIETRIDLSGAFNAEGLGHAILIVEPTANVTTPYGNARFVTWIQSTRLGLTVQADHKQMLAWVNSLRDGAPVPNAALQILTETPSSKMLAKGQTADSGFATVPLPTELGRKLLIARAGNDSALLPENNFYWSEHDGQPWRAREKADDLRWHVFDDRGLYRPGEQVHVKGWLRRIVAGADGDVALLRGAQRVRYAVSDSQDHEITQGVSTINALGGFDLAFKLPPVASLGFAHIKFTAEGAFASIDENDGLKSEHRFQIQEFRRPEFEVKLVTSEGPYVIGGHAELTVAANYYAGGGLPDTEIEWLVGSVPADFTPPNRGDYTFGKWIPWWDWNERDSYGEPGETYKARTDASGKHTLRVDLEAIHPARPMMLTVEASITDVNRQRISGSAGLIIHPASLYVGLRSPRTFVQPNQSLEIEAIATDLDGKYIANREIKMRVVRLDWSVENGLWSEREVEPQECSMRSTAAGPVKCSFMPKAGGRHCVTASIRDDRERLNESELSLWVAGGKMRPETDAQKLTQEKLELIPSQPTYRPGDVAELLVQAPFADAAGLLIVERDGILMSEPFKMSGTSHTLRIPIRDAYTPNIHVRVELRGATLRLNDKGEPEAGLPLRPAFAKGELNLSVPPVQRRLQVTATPRAATLEPGGSTVVDVNVRDAAGKPVRSSEVALVVVDEAVLALTSYEAPDLLKTFYPQRDGNVGAWDSRDSVYLRPNEDLISQVTDQQIYSLPLNARGYLSLAKLSPGLYVQTESASMSSETVMVMASAPENDFKTRRNFNALATFAAALPTDANGRAQVTVKLPDNLTRYRVMAVAVAGGNQFGSGESSITARLPLMVRPSAPRFLNLGDQFELPVVVQNQTDKPLTVDVAVRATNAIVERTAFRLQAASLNTQAAPPASGTSNAAGRRVIVPPNDRLEIRFPAATISPGQACFQIAATTGKFSDAAEISLPVWTPATTEAFAVYGELDEGALRQPVQTPADVFTEFGGLELTTSSTQLQALTDAVIYLTNYPYECAEQISSRVLALVALRDVLQAFNAPGLPQASEVKAAVARDFQRLATMQNENGAFGFWRAPKDDEDDYPFLGIHAAHAMARAKAKGFDVSAQMLERSQEYIKDIEDHIPSKYDDDTRQALRAYALYVRKLFNDRDVAKARDVLRAMGGVERSSLESLGWLLPVFAGQSEAQNEIQTILRHVANRAEETAATAHFTTTYQTGGHLLLHSDRRTDAILLEALIGADAKNVLIPKIVRGLLDKRTAGRWESTQENCAVLLALDRYFATYEKATPAFVARAWLGERLAGEHAFRGRTTEPAQIKVPMRWLAEHATQDLTLGKDGTGRLYYRLALNYAPRELALKPAEAGFTVTRTYEAIDDPSDVQRLPDGTWRIRAGAQVRVRLSVTAPSVRYHVALVDALPAGFEALNAALAMTGRISSDDEEDKTSWRWRDWRMWHWFDHENLRDERVEVFAAEMSAGAYRYSYVARATTPGRFIVPPTKAEEMYHPETFGRGSTERVIVE